MLKKSIFKRFKEILAKQMGIRDSDFSIEQYFAGGWMGEEDIKKGIETLFQEKNKKG